MKEHDATEIAYQNGYEAGKRDSKKKEKARKQTAATIDLANDDFGAVLNCAVRYAIGRQTYMPSLVIATITPLLPSLSDTTLRCFDQDIVEAKWTGGYGDPTIDEPHWMRFHDAVREERKRRGHELYKSWRDNHE
jgi:hypothetical protein